MKIAIVCPHPVIPVPRVQVFDALAIVTWDRSVARMLELN